MPEEPEIETHELQETLEELQEERREREEEQHRNAWVRYIALTTAILAVFAAIGAMQSGALVNEAMISQIQAADTWNEYQADSLKGHTYGIAANGLLDAGASLPAGTGPAESTPAEPHPAAGKAKAAHGKRGAKKGVATGPARKKPKQDLKAMAPADRLAYYRDQIDYENEKKTELQRKATELEHESEERMHHHHRFALSVALIQVAIALSAVAALARMKAVWIGSLIIGGAGVAYFVAGFVGV